LTKNKGRPEILRGKFKNVYPPGPVLVLGSVGGPRTETKFTKWSASLKRLKTA